MSASHPSKQLDESILEIKKPLPLGRTIFAYGMSAIAFTLTALALLPLIAILLKIFQDGLPNLKPEVFVQLPAPPPILPGDPNGFGNAIVGTLIMVGIAAIISIPIGIMTGIFLAEFGNDGAIANFVRFINTILTGVPSIIAGVFVYGVLILNHITQFSAIAGGFALSIIMLPIVVLTCEQALKLVPNHQRLASAALGASRLQTTFRIAVAGAIPAITTGILLAVARAAGETAPLIFTALFSDIWSEGLLDPTPALSTLIYKYSQSPDIIQNQMAWTASLVLVGLVLCISILARLATRQRGSIR
jgi:phosphate transport system permease protein